MAPGSGHRDPSEFESRLRDAPAVTAELLSDVINEACRRFPPIRRTEKAARLERLIQSGAWTDAAMALIELELPQWQIRRIVMGTNGIARYRASASFPNGSISRSKPATRICRLRS